MADERVPVAKKFGRQFVMVSMALIILAVLLNMARDSSLMTALPTRDHVIIKWALFAIWTLIGVVVIRHAQNVLLGMLKNRKRADTRASSAMIRAFSVIGYGFVAVESLHLLQVRVTSILVGGALTGVIVGMAAQSTLSNLFAGILLFTLRPFRIGQTVIIRSSMFGGMEYTGTVIDNNWFYTKVINRENHVITMPNSAVVVATVTALAQSRIQTYTVPVPYYVSMTDIEAALKVEVGDDVSVDVKEFGETSYTVQICLPIHASAETLRKVMATLREQQVTS